MQRRIGLAALLLLACAAPALAQSSSALINQALDKQVTLNLEPNVLPEIMRKIGNETGVKLEADPAVWDLLPWGEQTSIEVNIQNQTLRQALSAITMKLGLTFTLTDQAVMLKPLPALRRKPNRATIQELRAIESLASHPFPKPADARTVQAVVSAVDAAFGPDQLNTEFAVKNTLTPELRAAAVEVGRNATLLDALEAVAAQTQATWYPYGKDIVVQSKQAQVRNQLAARTITARYAGADIGQVLSDLQRRSGIDFTIDPGALLRIPADARLVKVVWDNVSIAQALESLKGATGLDYKLGENGVAISNPTPPTAIAPAPAGMADPIVAQMALPNGLIVFIRESQLPPKLKPYLNAQIQKKMEEMEKSSTADDQN